MPPTFDVVDLLRNGISSMPEGPHLAGLRAVVVHLETAINHLLRGRAGKDATAFTDAIYRTNQAFEGAIKEAYRVLAKKDPSKKRPFDIEEYLQNQEIFRPRVLTMFKSYRTEWRNPSAHDYLLDFDESEAVLAIITVAAFGYLLSDQILESLARDAGAAIRPHMQDASGVEESNDLMTRISRIIQLFASETVTDEIHTESQILGSLTGFIERLAPDLVVQRHAVVSNNPNFRVDMLIKINDQYVIVEIKRGDYSRNLAHSIDQLRSYLDQSDFTCGILYVHPMAGETGRMNDIRYSNGQKEIRVLAFAPEKLLHRAD